MFYRRPFDEDLIGSGRSVWYLELGTDGYPLRQIEVYEDGTVLSYDHDYLSDDDGMLGDQPMDLQDFEPFKIERDEFENQWREALVARAKR